MEQRAHEVKNSGRADRHKESSPHLPNHLDVACSRRKSEAPYRAAAAKQYGVP
jgi:hypothetical protein